MKFKKDGTTNPAYESVGQLTSQFKSIQNYGYDEASRIRVNGKSGNISENMFVGRDGEQVVSSWRINSSFFNEVRGGEAPGNADCATFNIDIFIMAIARELTAEGEETGRLKIRGGVVQCRSVSIREKFLTWMFGRVQKVMILVPGNSVSTVTITEVQEGGKASEAV